MNIQRDIEKIIEQVKHLQSVVNGSQKQIIQIQGEISAVERAPRGKRICKVGTQKRGALISIKGKAAKNEGKRKKIR